jgi:DNA helicase II / ATP-dependent DNA helicase PcrA
VPASQVKHMLGLARQAVIDLRALASAGGDGSMGRMLRLAVETGLVDPDPRLSAYLDPEGDHGDVVLSSSTMKALGEMMLCDVAELEGYFRYIRQESPYSTQHGTKGSEFRKVIVVLDDDEGRFTLYSYEKLFGLKNLSAADLDNRAEGKDSVIERTRRLLYVCVSRAVESLAVVLFVQNVGAAVVALQVSPVVNEQTILTLDNLS